MGSPFLSVTHPSPEGVLIDGAEGFGAPIGLLYLQQTQVMGRTHRGCGNGMLLQRGIRIVLVAGQDRVADLKVLDVPGDGVAGGVIAHQHLSAGGEAGIGLRSQLRSRDVPGRCWKGGTL